MTPVFAFATYRLHSANLNLAVQKTEQQELKAKEAAVSNERHFLKTLIDSLPIPIVQTDAEGKFQLYNKAFSNLFSVTETSDGLYSLPQFEGSADHIAQLSKLLNNKDEAISYEALLQDPNSSRHPKHGLVHISKLRNIENDVIGTIVAIIDVSEIVQSREAMIALARKLQYALTHEEQMSKAKNQFIENMTHELRTPLNGIVGMAGLLKTAPIPPAYIEYADILEKSSLSLANILSDIMSLSELEVGTAVLTNSQFSLETIVKDVVSSLKPTAVNKKLDVNLNYSNDLKKIFLGDHIKIRQIIFNLIANAIKFTEQGEININVKPESVTDTEAKILIQIADTGIGIDKDKRISLFKSFTQLDAGTNRKFGGLGLGLALCMNLIKLMRGNIDFESEQGKGTTFNVQIKLPIVSEDETTIQKRPEQKFPKFDLRVMLTEDNSVNRMVAIGLLNKFGCKVDYAENGEECLKKLKHDNKYDLILMDCQMPIMDGYEATQLIRKEIEGGEMLFIAALTANALQEDREKCFEAGMNEYLTKPINKTRLAQILQMAQNHKKTSEP